MKIKWLGHSCFLLTSAAGVRILTDPFDSHVGYALPAVEADVVTTSHNHGDHNHIQAVKGHFTHLREPGCYKHGDIVITGFPSFHDNEGGIRRGKNIIYIFNIDGIRVCHCGDLGHVPSDKLVKDIGSVDVLLVPVGSVYTINASEALQVAGLLKPSVTIPMHFKTPVLNFPLDDVEKFLQAAGSGVKAGKQEIEITAENLAIMPKVLVLEYK